MENKQPVTHFQELVQKHLEDLHKFQEETIKPLKYYTYPSRPIILMLEKQLLPKLKNRKLKSQILSDILMWFLPKFVSFIAQINSFIAQLSNNQRTTSMSLIKINKTQDFSVENLLRTPLQFFQTTIQKTVKEYIQQYQKQQQNWQYNSLTRFLKLYGDLKQQFSNSELSGEEIEKNVEAKLYDNIPFCKRRVVVKFVMRTVFLSKLKQRSKKAEKRIKERKMRFQELLDGEKKYTQGLMDYIEYIKKPIQSLNILSNDENMRLFSTIQPILSFHTHFLKELAAKFQNYEKYQIFGDIFLKNIPFFKIYTDYIMYADEAEKIILALQDEHEEVQQICSKFMSEKEKKASDELKQPTFRIARYDMILTEVIKKTNPIHPDYSILLKAQAQFVNLLRKVNSIVDVQFRRNRLNQLEQQFGTQQNPIFIPNRQFFEEFSMFLIKEEKLIPVIVFVFNDFLMVIDESRKIIKWININIYFYVRRQEDNKTYKNIIKVHSDGFDTFSAGSEDKNFNKAVQFYDLLCKVSTQNQELNQIIYVQVIGTEEIGSTSFAKHTEYITEVKFMGLRKFLHLRFSQIKPLLTKLQQYLGDLNIIEEESLKKNWFNNHKSKTIEDRKRIIEQILQKILNNQNVKKNPTVVFNELGIDSAFLNRRENVQKKRATIVATHGKSFVEQASKMKSKKKQSKEAETILCATQIKLGRDMLYDPEEEMFERKKTEGEKIEIYVNTMVNEEPITVKINQLFTVEDVCYKVSKLIGLRMNRDFRLFHQIGKKQLRALDPQQKIMKIFKFPKKENSPNFVNDFFESIKKIITPDTHPTLVFKKYYFLPIEIELSQSRRDLTRLRLLVYQIFNEIKQMKYQLTFDQYLLFLSLMLYIEFEGKIPDNVDEEYVDRLIPETIFKLKNYNKQQWIAKCRPHAKRLDEQINKIITYNREQLKNKKIKTDSVSKTALYFGHRHLCSQIVLNKIKNNPIYGSNLFYVQPYKSTYDKLIKENCKMAYNMWLAIKVESLNLLYPSSKETVLELQYKNIEKIFVYSQAIIFKMDGLITTEYRLNTYQSFQISQLVNYNKALNETLRELEKNQDLIAKARSYKQELLIYRNTKDVQQ